MLEVVKGDVVYNIEVDMYFFGMFFYEFVIGGKVLFEDFCFGYELDVVVMKGRVLDLILLCNCFFWLDVVDFIVYCFEL